MLSALAVTCTLLFASSDQAKKSLKPCLLQHWHLVAIINIFTITQRQNRLLTTWSHAVAHEACICLCLLSHAGPMQVWIVYQPRMRATMASQQYKKIRRPKYPYICKRGGQAFHPV